MKVFHKECDGNTVGFACVWNKEKLAREDLEKICNERESFQKRLFCATQKFSEASNEFEKHKERYNITE